METRLCPKYLAHDCRSANVIGKHLRPSLFLDKYTGLRTATLLKKRVQHRCLPVNFEENLFHRTTLGDWFC